MSDSPSLARLVERARDTSTPLQAQHTAFGEIVRRTQHVVFGLALVSLQDVDDAKDAAQETFIIAWRRIAQLRDPSSTIPWLRRIVATACTRHRRKRREMRDEGALDAATQPADVPIEYQSLIASALKGLPAGERDVTVLFYFLGYTTPQIGKLLRLKPGTVGKRLHSARLRIRRGLPRSVRDEFVRLAPPKEFVEQVNLGLLDDYVGEYRFEKRPELVVTITREKTSLVSVGNGQRHVVVAVGAQSLLATTFDGEARFRRNRRGQITHFVYYEFGRRMGVARKAT